MSEAYKKNDATTCPACGARTTTKPGVMLCEYCGNIYKETTTGIQVSVKRNVEFNHTSKAAPSQHNRTVIEHNSGQSQCPNCGSYYIQEQDQGGGCAGLYLYTIGWMAPLAGVLIMSSGNVLDILQGILLIAVGIAPLIFIVVRTDHSLVECRTCGKKWKL